jgi:pimeloyl-ACP methyl ester carboxylesterase
LGRVRCVVAGRGRPTIVLINGAGLPLESWSALYPAIERLGRVLAWNRPGLPGSERPARRINGLDVIAQLRELLSRLELPPPYVLVGHSLGGLYAQLLARSSPADVAGVLLLAPTPPSAGPRLRQRQAQIVRSLARLAGTAPDALRRNVRAELAGFDETVKALAEAGPWPGVPLRVVAPRGTHFPQLVMPHAVLAALREVVAAVKRSARGPAPSTPADQPA